MINKRTIVVALAGLNLLLLTALILVAEPTPAAHAQAGPGGRGYLCATASVTGQEYEVLYILDMGGRRLYSLGPTNPQSGKLEYFGVRDLKQDFRNEGAAAPTPP
ncbi:MAG: hypothetical protein FLDDKLPJ_02024 [Phycisphaerae bacterium]|nr:hypothetical protein [Phycisphaerae bacterium]